MKKCVFDFFLSLNHQQHSSLDVMVPVDWLVRRLLEAAGEIWQGRFLFITRSKI